MSSSPQTGGGGGFRCTRKLTLAMSGGVLILVIALTVGLCVGLSSSDDVVTEDTPPFSIDHTANTFLLNGEPFRYVSGSFHYFRALPDAWRSRLRTMRASGLNALDTYVEWSLHNPHDGEYNWEGIADVVKFLEIAQEEDFYIILRPGPYICAERDNGGLPHWLFTKYPDIKVRTNDADYIKEVGIWYAQLMPRLQHLLIGNGGKIIMVQVENEYAAYYACDHDYLNWLRDETEKYVDNKALLFTVDIPNERMSCGKIDNVFATTDFGIDRIFEIENIWKMLRELQPTGPLVNSEFYPGWLTHWQETNQRRDGQEVADALKTILSYNASVNLYMFFGGTNFGFTAGANYDLDGNIGYAADITSYDYDAVMDEAGGVTTKYELVKQVIGEVLELPQITLEPAKRLAYGKVELTPALELLSPEGRAALSKGTPVTAEKPKSFEEVDQYSGLLLYETTLPDMDLDPTLLKVEDLRDRAHVFVDRQLVGTLSREARIYQLPLSKGWGNTLQLLVENQGRINYDRANDTKGIFGQITMQLHNGGDLPLENWTTTAFPLEEATIAAWLAKRADVALDPKVAEQRLLRTGPIAYTGSFSVQEVGDTYLNMAGWGKGVAYVNGFNLGRYWPLGGPQITLYVPNELLKVGENSLVLLEYQRCNKTVNGSELPAVQLDAVAQLDGESSEAPQITKKST
ncbi:beta-galactosidase [Drosophila sulfurigaster albostrigata]|uniref:beta-galactosidase n=1 Tax=Drosophila sulfurigaster albostrigata TaxID=89887 RepID=UPI002D21E58C|nr:beta-galactosidase [Drosophila sulfurigaster albostrigata]